MPAPIEGLVVAAECDSIMEADLIVARLDEAGIQAIKSHDPALGSHLGHLATDRTVQVLVREMDLRRAKGVLDDALPPAFRDEAMAEGWSARTHGRRPQVRPMSPTTAIGLITFLVGVPIVYLIVAVIRHGW